MFIPPFGYGLFDSGFQRSRRRYPVRVSPMGGAAKKRTWKRSVRAGKRRGRSRTRR